MKTLFHKYIFLVFFIVAYSSLQSATYRDYVSHEMINATTLRIWINSDTQFGETAVAEARWDTGGGSYNYTGIIDGSYDDMTVVGANWRVDLTIPSGTNVVDYQLGNRNQSNTVYGLSGFVSTLTGLPVELTNFTVKNFQTYSLLKWQTTSESNNSHFEIQRSSSSKSWSNIGQVQGVGTTAEIQSYSFEDTKPLSGRNYYRLKQLDFDGSYSYSPIVSLTRKGQGASIYPNPFSSFFEVKFVDFEKTDTYNLFLTNSLGVIIKKIMLESSFMQVDMRDLPTGIYTLSIFNKRGEMLFVEQLSKL